MAKAKKYNKNVLTNSKIQNILNKDGRDIKILGSYVKEADDI